MNHAKEKTYHSGFYLSSVFAPVKIKISDSYEIMFVTSLLAVFIGES
jgi:hypothetical protein